MRVYQDRFLNEPAARLPQPGRRDPRRADVVLGRAGAGLRRRRHRLLLAPRRRRPRPARRLLGRALLAEDAGFHWYQTL